MHGKKKHDLKISPLETTKMKAAAAHDLLKKNMDPCRTYLFSFCPPVCYFGNTYHYLHAFTAGSVSVGQSRGLT